MAGTADAPAKREQKDPIYHVAAVQTDGSLKIIAQGVSAKTQEKAMDATAEGLDSQNEFMLAAFLASSLRGKKYNTRRVTVREGVEFDPLAPPPEPVSAD